MEFRGAQEIPPENLDAPVTEIWYQDIKEIPSTQLPERALVAAKMSLFWRADRRDKPVYVEDKTNVALYVVAYKKEKGKMTTVQLGADEEPWYHQMVKNFVLPKDTDLEAQPSADVGELINLGVGPESKKNKRGPVSSTAPKKTDAPKADVPKEEKKKEGLAPVAVKQPKAEPRDTVDILVLNPDEPIDVKSSPEPLVRTKAVKRKKPEGEAAARPAKKISRKKIGKKEKPVLSVQVETLSAFNDDRPPSPPTSSKGNLEGIKTVEAEVEKTVEAEAEKTVEAEVEKTVEAEVEVETTDAGVTRPVSPEDSAQENPENIEYQAFVVHDEEEESPIRPDETPGDYYYRTYSEKGASDIHAPVWELKQGDTFSDWKDAVEASKKEVVEEKAKVVALRAKLEADQAKFEGGQKTEEWSAMSWKKKAEVEAAQLAKAHKRWKEAEIEKLKKEKADAEAARDEARSHRERSEQREVQTCANLALRNKEIEELTSLLDDQEQVKEELESAKKDLQLAKVEKAEATRRLSETEEKLESSETARVTAESLVEALKNNMLWMPRHGIINVANSILNWIDLDQTVANLKHITNALRVNWDTSRSATCGVDTGAAHAAAKEEYNNLRLPVMDLVTTALQSEKFVDQLKEIFPDEAGASDEEDL
ncbi:titin homolog [Helianthus annuus]|uniref:titin homolog n=1 Tax=Helianthus annuus TaxID=4232 RepID=UPI000B901636|nr:titin homolog [Helianthus annuus]